MMKGNWKMYLLLVIPWFSIRNLGKVSLLRFLPTIIFSDLVIALISEISQNLKPKRNKPKPSNKSFIKKAKAGQRNNIQI
ncbi:hypothetical protein NDK25_13625 [Niallia taxi]|nr:hypothetical protein [Niallia taxi]MDE5053274.1 hypothetical protein [Niallia taxi]